MDKSDIETRKAAARERYLAAAHAMQSGVAFDPDTSDREPKHLRVGINSAMSDISAIASLLIERGIFTELEYIEVLANHMEQERDRYEIELTEKLGAPVKLA